MNYNEELLTLLAELNFRSAWDLDLNKKDLNQANVFERDLVVNEITKDLILVIRPGEGGKNEKKYFLTKYDIYEIKKRLKQSYNRICVYTGRGYVQSTEVYLVNLIQKSTDFYDYHYCKYPEGWITENELVEWLKKKKEEEIPKTLIKIKNEQRDSSDFRQIEVLFKIIARDKEILFKMAYEGKYIKYSPEKVVTEIEPICNFMLGWDKKRLLEYCTINNLEVEQLKVLNSSAN